VLEPFQSLRFPSSIVGDRSYPSPLNGAGAGASARVVDSFPRHRGAVVTAMEPGPVG